MDCPAVCFDHVRFSYGERCVLEDVDLDLLKGELHCIVGPNGGGKTTLLRLMMGFLRPDEGAVSVFGKAPREQRDVMGYVPQAMGFDFRFPVTVQDVVLMGLSGKRKWGWYRQEDRRAAGEALEKVDMGGVGKKGFSELSGGQRQRVLIARALVNHPQLLLLDEPTANVDPRNAERLYETIQELRREVTCVLVSHEVEFVTSLVKEVVCVHGHVDVHPTEEMECEEISEFLGTKVRRVVHDRHLPPTEHDHGHG